MINVGLIGAGYWGTIHYKTLQKMEGVNVKYICTLKHSGKFGSSIITNHLDWVIYDDEVDCVIIATPAKTHFEIAKKCIEANKPCLVEKPFTLTSDEAKELVELNKKVDTIVMPGHVYLHHPGIKKLKELIDFDVKQAFSRRMSHSKYPNSLNEIAVHDVYIFEYLFGKHFSIKSAMGDEKHSIFNLEFKLPSYKRTDVSIETSSTYPGKIREIIIEGHDQMLVFDETKHGIVCTDYSTDVENRTASLEYYNEAVTPLELQAKHFFDCVQGKDTPIVTELDGLRSIEKLEQILFKLKMFSSVGFY